MIRSPIHYSIFILIALFLAACGPRPTPLPSAIVLTDAPTRTAFPTITATPSPGLFTAIHSQITYVPTRTPMPTKTHTVAPTTTSTFVPTLPPATPMAGPEGYRLREWLFQDAQLAISEAEGILELWDWAAPEASNRRDLYEDYFITIGQETARRFPQAVARTSLYWKLGAYEAETWNQTHPVENFRLALETSLNSGEMIFSQLDNWLRDYRYFLSVEAVYTTTNLFGDGQTAIVFQVTVVDEESVTFVLTGSKPGEYRVSTPYENWFVTYHAGETIAVTDLNGNGQPEIQRVSWGRWDIFCGSGLALYEWRGPYPGGAFVDLARNIPEINVEGVDNFDCTESWRIGSIEANGAQSIVAVLDPFYAYKNLNCKDDELRATYRWNGLFYEWAGQSIDSTSNSHSLACAVLWANWAGGMSDEAISIMATALENWPTEIDGLHDSITPDNFRFKLGTWYALRGETELAQNTLQVVRDHPVNPKADTAGQMARAYLADYQIKHSPFTACRAAIDAFEAIRPAERDSLFFWNAFVVAPYGICNLHQALQQTALTFQPQTTAELLGWFDEQRIEASTITKGDVNSDGRDDWLAHIKLRDGWSLWAFISSENGLRAVFVAEHVGQGESLVATLTQVPAEIDLASINVFTLGGRSTAFQIIEHEGVLAAIPYPTTLLPPEYQQPLYDDEKLALAGKVLFQSGGNTQALTLLEELQDASTVDRGHVLYLLGLAHELSGHEREAVQAYWQLWHDYPDSPYTLIARRKLEVVGP